MVLSDGKILLTQFNIADVTESWNRLLDDLNRTYFVKRLKGSVDIVQIGFDENPLSTPPFLPMKEIPEKPKGKLECIAKLYIGNYSCVLYKYRDLLCPSLFLQCLTNSKWYEIDEVKL